MKNETTMTQLSPAAQAVRDAVLATYADSIPKDDNLWALERASIVAALRAAADQNPPDGFTTGEYDAGWSEAMAAIFAIAIELEGA